LEFPVEEPGNSSIIYTKDVENKIYVKQSKQYFLYFRTRKTGIHFWMKIFLKCSILKNNLQKHGEIPPYYILPGCTIRIRTTTLYQMLTLSVFNARSPNRGQYCRKMEMPFIIKWQMKVFIWWHFTGFTF